MASTCVAVVVLFLIKQALAIPGDAVMYMPPLEVRTLDMNDRAFPFINAQLFSGNQQSSPIKQSPMQQSTMQESPAQLPTIQRPSIMQPIMSQSSMQQPSMQPTMSQSSMQQPSMQPMMPQSSMQLPSMSQPIFHHTSVQTSLPESTTPRPHERRNMTFNDFVEVLNEISERNKDSVDEEEGFERAAGNYGYSAPPLPPPSYPPYTSYQPVSRPYGPPRPSYGTYGPPPPPPPAPAYHEPVYAPPAIHHHKAAKAGLVSSLFKPVTNKVASKVSGLLGIVLSLLSGAPGSEFSGFKDVIVNGIIKPLLIVKGGIKSLISKLVVPVIALLLINVEVLITVWWLWDDCPKPIFPYPPPPPPPAYDHPY